METYTYARHVEDDAESLTEMITENDPRGLSCFEDVAYQRKVSFKRGGDKAFAKLTIASNFGV
jgi:hypothetical protein